jgi:hypothetical protein
VIGAAGRDSEFIGLLVAASPAEQKTAQPADELLRFVRSWHEISDDDDYRSPRRSRHPAFVLPSARCISAPI